ncbi:MAG: thioredoxin domain-containing protein [Bacteroidales bacterium]|nr:thioredoxin domain-containing protein [Bacteroidales bacterium]MDD3891820.1 thioredoxin domain-containing protein [Bacteroidales bacterium]
MKNKHTIIALLLSLILVILIAYQLGNRFIWKQSNSDIQAELKQNDLDIVFGSDTAKLSIYMYSSYACTYCKKFFDEVLPKLKPEYIDNGEVNIIVRLVDHATNPTIANANKIAICINRYGYYEKLHELFVANFKVVSTSEFESMIDEFTLADDLVAECYFGGEAEDYLNETRNQFDQLRFKGTPTFVIKTSVFGGFVDYEQFSEVINHYLLNN